MCVNPKFSSSAGNHGLESNEDSPGHLVKMQISTSLPGRPDSVSRSEIGLDTFRSNWYPK